jgi:hypothetical protein
LGSVDPKADQVIPVVSRQTHERAEGYFRLEWKLAVDRSHFIVANKAFLLPVVIDDTRDDDENVPEKFREVHWTRLPDGDTPPDAGYDRPEKKAHSLWRVRTNLPINLAEARRRHLRAYLGLLIRQLHLPSADPASDK